MGTTAAWVYDTRPDAADHRTAMWATPIAAYNREATASCARISHVFAYGGSLEYYSQLTPPWQIYTPDDNLEAARQYAQVRGVQRVTLVLDGVTGRSAGGVDLAARADAELADWARAIAARVCAVDVVDGVQLDLEPLQWSNLGPFLSLVTRLSIALREPACISDAYPSGRAVSAFGGAVFATRSMWRALGPNGYYVVSGYDLATSSDGASSPDEYARKLSVDLDTIVLSAGRNDGRFMVGIPAAASTKEFASSRRVDTGEVIRGHAQIGYVLAALQVLEAKRLAANPGSFLGTAVWGFAPKIEAHGTRYSPSDPFVDQDERSLLLSELCRASGRPQ